MPTTIESLAGTVSPADTADLAALLRDAIDGGASIGFLLPVSDAEVAETDPDGSLIDTVIYYKELTP